MRILHFYIAILISIFSNLNIAASDVVFDKITTEDGLPSNTIYKIAQDTNGFIWMATREGLIRYDGSTYKTYTHSKTDTNSIPFNLIEDFTISKNNIMYLGFRNHGFSEFDIATETFTNYPFTGDTINNIPDKFILSIYADTNSICWLGTFNGLSKFNTETKTFKNYSFKSAENNFYFSNFITDIAKTNDGKLLLLCQLNILYIFDPTTEKFEQVQFTKELNHIFQNNGGVLNVSNNSIWIGTELQGLFCYDYLTKSLQHFSKENNQISSNLILDLLQDSDNNIWIGTDGGGINKYDIKKNSFETYTYNTNSIYGPTTNAIYSICETSDKNIWFGTYNAGISIYNKTKSGFRVYSDKGENGRIILKKSVLSFAQLDKNTILIGTDNGGIGVYSKSANKIHNITKENSSLHSNIIKTMLLNSDHQLWIGTYSDGLGVYNFPNLKSVYIGDLKSSNNTIRARNVWDITEDSAQNIWIGLLSGGIDVYNPKENRFTNYPYIENCSKSISGENINAIFCDSKNRIWVGTALDGVNIFDRKTNSFIYFKHNDSIKSTIPGNEIRAFFESSDGTIWIGTKNEGFCKLVDLEKQTYKSYSTLNGLGNNDVLSFLEDSKGNLWLATQRGISIFNPTTETFLNLGADNGISIGEMNFGAALKDSDGYFYFGGTEGFVWFHPDSIYLPSFEYPIYITNIKLNNICLDAKSKTGKRIGITNSVIQTDTIYLKYDDDIFSLDFSCVDLNIRKAISYKYKLEGFETEWNYINSKNATATYTNLPLGKYTLVITSKNIYGQWSNKQIRLTIFVSPPWWLEIWFFIIVFVIISFSLVLFYKLRTRKIIKNNKELALKIKESTHELEQTNKELVVKNNLLVLRQEELNATTLELQNQSDELYLTNTELKSVNKTKDKLLSIIAHDIRNHISGIYTASEIINENKITSDKLFTRFLLIKEFAKSSLNVLENLLSWNNLRNGQIEPVYSDIDLQNIVQSVINEFNSSTQLQKITLKNEIPINLFVSSDEHMLKTITRNLINNAIKATPELGTISISALTKDNSVYVSVSDTGVGMNNQKLMYLFDEQVNVSDNKISNGLGLKLCKELCNILTQTITVESVENKGTQITFTLPLSDTKNTHKELDEIIVLNSNPKIASFNIEFDHSILDPIFEKNNKIALIVDDNINVREKVKDILQDEFIILEADNGKTALEIAQEQLPNIIISDIMMPEMNGFEFCAHIKENSKTNHIPIILVTALHSLDARISSLSKGADDIITKPFDKTDLKAKVHALLLNLERNQKHFQSNYIESKTSSVAIQNEFTNLVHDILEKNISNPNLSVEFIADKIGFSRIQLFRKLKAITGISPTEFILDYKLNKACELLKSENLNISEIAYTVGFSTPKYFTNCFKKKFGITPSVFSKNRS